MAAREAEQARVAREESVRRVELAREARECHRRRVAARVARAREAENFWRRVGARVM